MKPKYITLICISVLLLGVIVYAGGTLTREIPLQEGRINKLNEVGLVKPVLSDITCDGVMCSARLVQYKIDTNESCNWNCGKTGVVKCKVQVCSNFTVYTTLMDTEIKVSMDDKTTDEIQKEFTDKIKERLNEIADYYINQSESKAGDTNIGGGGDIVYTIEKP